MADFGPDGFHEERRSQGWSTRQTWWDKHWGEVAMGAWFVLSVAGGIINCVSAPPSEDWASSFIIGFFFGMFILAYVAKMTMISWITCESWTCIFVSCWWWYGLHVAGLLSEEGVISTDHPYAYSFLITVFFGVMLDLVRIAKAS